MPEHITELSHDEIEAVSGGGHGWFFSDSQSNFASVSQNAQSFQGASNFAYGYGNVQANVQVATNTNIATVIQNNFD